MVSAYMFQIEVVKLILPLLENLYLYLYDVDLISVSNSNMPQGSWNFIFIEHIAL